MRIINCLIITINYFYCMESEIYKPKEKTTHLFYLRNPGSWPDVGPMKIQLYSTWSQYVSSQIQIFGRNVLDLIDFLLANRNLSQWWACSVSTFEVLLLTIHYSHRNIWKRKVHELHSDTQLLIHDCECVLLIAWGLSMWTLQDILL